MLGQKPLQALDRYRLTFGQAEVNLHQEVYSRGEPLWFLFLLMEGDFEFVAQQSKPLAVSTPTIGTVLINVALYVSYTQSNRPV